MKQPEPLYIRGRLVAYVNDHGKAQLRKIELSAVEVKKLMGWELAFIAWDINGNEGSESAKSGRVLP